MISLGIMASGLVGGVPPGPTPEYGGIKILTRFRSDGLVSACTEGPIPGISPAFDMVDMVCKNIYQRYRVYDPGISSEIATLAVVGISGDYAVSFDDSGSRYAFITPYKKDATLIADVTEWETDCTLTIGTDINAIDFGAENIAFFGSMIAPNRFLAYCLRADAVDLEDLPRVLTFYIVDFSSPTSHTLLPVEVDLDVLGDFSPNQYFDQYQGVQSLAFDQADNTQLAVVLNSSYIDYSGPQAIGVKVNTTTGAITSHTSDPADGGTYMSPLWPMGDTSSSIFENGTQYRAGQYDIGSFDSILAHGSSSAMQKRTFTGRTVGAAPQRQTEFEGEETHETENIDNAMAVKLTALGYEIDQFAIPSRSFHFAPFFDEME